MPVPPLKKIAFADAREICARFPVSDAAKAIATELPPADYLTQLMAAGHFIDAVRFLAHALPKREAVWWACVCARERLRPDAPPPVIAALQAAESWVYQPTEPNRRAAMAKAEAAGFDSSGAWAAVAAFWSGGSMAPPEAPVVPPGEALTGAAVAGSVLLAAVQDEPQKAPEKYHAFIAAGIDIANGGGGRPTQRAV